MWTIYKLEIRALILVTCLEEPDLWKAARKPRGFLLKIISHMDQLNLTIKIARLAYSIDSTSANSDTIPYDLVLFPEYLRYE